MLLTTVSRIIPSPSVGFGVAVAIILTGAIPRLAGAQSSDPTQLKEAAEQRGQRAEGFLRPLDANRNGLIEASEVNDEAKRYLERTAERYGVQATLPLSIDKYRTTVIEAYIRVRGSGGPGGPSGRGPAPSGSPGPGAGGFSMAQNASPSLGFGSSGTSSGMSGVGSTRTTSTGSSSGAVDERYRSYSANMLKRYDKNGNGALDREEWSQLRGEWWKSADANGDGTITVDEIIARLAGYRSRFQSRSSTTTSSTTSSYSSPSTTSSSPVATSSSSSATNSPSTSNASTATSTTSSPAPVVRKPYRFLTPAERLPAGLPDWFARKDANGDGQVTLAEFSDSLSDEVVAEFSKYDLNNDGAITPQECLKAMQGK